MGQPSWLTLPPPGRRALFLFFLLACVLPSGILRPAEESFTEKLPIPRQPAQAKADHDLRQRLKADFDRHDAGSDAELARKLRDEAASASEPATRFVMLKEARELFVDAGDIQSALAVVDQMGAAYAIDVRDMKLAAMSVGVDKANVDPAALTVVYLELGDRFLNLGDVDLAEHACRLAENITHNRRLRDPELKKRIEDQHRTVVILMKESQDVILAMRKLKLNPDDPQANLTVGKYACFFRGLWNPNLSLLAKCPDERLKQLAQSEQQIPTSPTAMLAVANGWWSVADSATTPVARRQIRRHAAEWYQKASAGLQGEQKQTAMRRIAEAEQ